MKSWNNRTKFSFVAACGLALIAGRAFHGHATAPLRESEAVAMRDAADLQRRIESAKDTIAAVRLQDQNPGRDQTGLEGLERNLPAGSAMIWLPPLVREHFGRAGIATHLVRLNTIRGEPGIPGCERGFWIVQVPIEDAVRNIPTVLLAIADLDRQKPFLRVLDFSIIPNPDHHWHRMAEIHIGILSPTAADSR